MPPQPLNPLLALGIATGILLFLTLAKWPLRALRRKLLALSVVWALTFWFVRDDLPPQLALYLATPESVAVAAGLPVALEALSAMWHYRGRILGRLRALATR